MKIVVGSEFLDYHASNYKNFPHENNLYDHLVFRRLTSYTEEICEVITSCQSKVDPKGTDRDKRYFYCSIFKTTM